MPRPLPGRRTSEPKPGRPRDPRNGSGHTVSSKCSRHISMQTVGQPPPRCTSNFTGRFACVRLIGAAGFAGWKSKPSTEDIRTSRASPGSVLGSRPRRSAAGTSASDREFAGPWRETPSSSVRHRRFRSPAATRLHLLVHASSLTFINTWMAKSRRTLAGIARKASIAVRATLMSTITLDFLTG